MTEQDSFAEQIEAGTSIHLPLEHLDAIDVAFDGAGAVGEGEPIADGIVIGLQATDEAVQLRQVIRPDRRHPGAPDGHRGVR